MVGLYIVPYKRKSNLQDGPGTHSLSGCIQDRFENIMFMLLGVEEGPFLSLFLSLALSKIYKLGTMTFE
jgi:hypothetical protein